MKETKRGFHVLSAICLAPAILAPAWAGSIKQAGLAEMVNRSGIIIVGTCTSAQPSTIQYQGRAIPVTRYAFRVTESIKGSPGSEYTLVQIGWPGRQSLSARGAGPALLPLVIDGLPEYQPSREYLLLLTRPGSLGLSSPIGLSQSAFVSESHPDGSRSWRNGFGNQGLFEKSGARYRRYLEAQGNRLSASGEPFLPYREFIEMVRAIAYENQ